MIDDPAAHALATLTEEAPDIPIELITRHDWFQDTLNLELLDVNEDMVERHDADPIHVARRDGFVARIRADEPIPPLIALGPTLHLVDGYARCRALRSLGVWTAAVLRQRT
ncbi:hypothetical protein [Actinopolymorpha pittospori]|uniref:ParB/Sulfiredoxin domain-containing protein n=1 Tax=Actinopolymorpha pittospori TaxID=648752 RepID=A0A927RLN9_9ACTN|nr:hypothetical protein [Actinopolymorpha pittospori]MBE1608043.1 hypothetical protein [Actinopolymorpha pittospori]